MLIVDFLLLLLIGVCIIYCVILNNRIKDLNNSRVDFARITKELHATILNARSSVQELCELSESKSEELNELLDNTKHSKLELNDANKKAIELINKVSILIKAREQNKNNANKVSLNEDSIVSDQYQTKSSHTFSAPGKKDSTRLVDERDISNAKYSKEHMKYRDIQDDKLNYDNFKDFITKVVGKIGGNNRAPDNANSNANHDDYFQSLRKIK
ncbi:MAG: hypothetical protein AB8B67_04135 [Rickettsiaceae bacterium]